MPDKAAKLPSAQGSHAAAEKPLMLPGEHSSQALEPGVLKDPAVQPKHFDIESAPRIAENLPAGHAWQSSGEPAATAVEKLPVGQAVQAVPFSA